jgi:proline dehydrogenase
VESIFAAFPRILDQFETNSDAREAFVFAAWPRAVGEGLSEHTMPVKLIGTRLRVGVANLMWQRHLETMAGEVLAKLNAVIGRPTVDFIEFCIDEEAVNANRTVQKQTVEDGSRHQVATLEQIDPELRSSASAISDSELRRTFLLAAGSCLERKDRLTKT